MDMVQASPQTDAERKAALHAQIDAMDAARLSLIEHVLLTVEVQELANGLVADFEEDRRTGKLTDEKIQAAIDAHRAAHPYR